jgi:hypothetical protein
MKKCTLCKINKRINHFHNDSSRKDGKFPWCDVCCNVNKKKYNTTEVTVLTSICSKCKKTLSAENFHKNKNTKNGLSKFCKICKAESDKQSHEKYKTKRNKKSKKYYKLNKKQISTQTKEKRKNSQDFRKQESERSKKYRENNIEKMKLVRREYYQKNKKKVNAKFREKRRNNPEFRLLNNMRSRLSAAIRIGAKNSSTKEYLGCEWQFFLKYLESKFNNGMTWENYGKYWHVDHIIPCCKFDLSTKEEQLKCFNYTNLQPLLAIDNLRKNKYG